MKRYPFLILLLYSLLTLICTVLISVNLLEDSIGKRIRQSDLETAHAIAISLNRESLSVKEAAFLVDAHFSLGAYRRIQLLDGQGNLLYSRQQNEAENPSPEKRLFWLWTVQSAEQAGAAQVKIRNPDSPIRAIAVKSETRFDGALTNRWLLLVLSANFVALCLSASVFRFFLRREDQSLSQLEAIIDRLAKGQPFQTAHSPEKSLEGIYKKLQRFSEELEFKIAKGLLHVAALNRQQRLDEATGLLNRGAFLKKLEEILQSGNLHEQGEVHLIRINNLSELNAKYGRTVVDSQLKRFTSALNHSIANQYEAQVGRVSGSDFGIVLPGLSPDQQHIPNLIEAQARQTEFHFSSSKREFVKGQKALQVLSDCERNLQAAQNQSGVEISALEQQGRKEELARWEALLSRGLNEHRFFLQPYKVINAQHQLLHHECFVRLQDNHSNGSPMTASALLPWANTLGLTGKIDLEVLKLALATAADAPGAICINLSELGLIDEDLRQSMLEMLNDAPRYAKMLWLDVPEKFAFEQPLRLKQWIDDLHPLGVKVGVEHLDICAGRLMEIQDTGLDYIKVAASLQWLWRRMLGKDIDPPP